MTDTLTRAAIALYDRFTHETHDRRAFMGELTRLAGSAAAATALLATIAADPVAAEVIAADDKRVRARDVTWDVGAGRQMKGYMALPVKARGKLPAVVVVHENRGLTGYVRDVARRVALAGYVALAPDFLTPGAGTPPDEDAARTAIGALDLTQTVADGVATLRWLGTHRYGTGKVGSVGFCWGGAMVDRLAVSGGDALTAGVSFYGPAPAPAEAAKVRAALLLHYAGLDDRVNGTGRPWAAALAAAGKDVTVYEYPNVNHAFHNDTAGERFNLPAATLAWERTIAFFDARLKA